MSLGVPSEHGVDGLLELGAAGLVDTERINPHVAATEGESLGTSAPHFVPGDSFVRWRRSYMVVKVRVHVLESDFVFSVAPRVGKNGVVGQLAFIGESLEFLLRYVKEAHRENTW